MTRWTLALLFSGMVGLTALGCEAEEPPPADPPADAPAPVEDEPASPPDDEPASPPDDEPGSPDDNDEPGSP